MKKLKPTSVRINWTGANASRNAFRSRFIPDKDTANALNEFLEFYAEIYPIIQQNFSSEYSRIKYNVDIDKIIDKLKGMGEII